LPALANFRRLAIVVAIAAITLFPWVLGNAMVMGKPTIATVIGGYTFWGANNELVAWGYGFHFVRTHLDDMPGLIVARLRRLISPFEATSNRPVYYSFAVAWLLTGPFVGYGTILVFRGHRLAAAVLLTPILAMIAIAIVFYGSIRFRDSVSPLLLVFAAAALIKVRSDVEVLVRARSAPVARRS
jgi:hypothetical protein